jgi:hypothetical protein
LALKQEHRFVADLYRYLAPFIDTSREMYLSLDGVAARRGVTGGHFVDPDVPDLWFYLAGAQNVTLLEAKIVGSDGIVLLGRGQLSAWRTGGQGAHKPTAWVGSNEEFSVFYFWLHTAFCTNRLDGSRSSQDNIPFRLPESTKQFPDIRQLALHVLRNT